MSIVNPKYTKAILIGVSEFIDKEYFVDALPIKNNVSALKKLLQDSEILGLQESNILFFDQNQSHQEILVGIDDFLKKTSTDTVFFYFAGHGYKTDDHLYLVTNNSKGNIIHSTAILWDDIRKLLEKSHGIQQRFYFLDACHSGKASLSDDKTFDEIETGSAIIAAASEDEKAYFDKKEKYTYFTKAFINTLTNGDENTELETLNIDKIYNNIESNLRANGNRFRTQIKKTDRIDNVFLFKNKRFDTELNKRKLINEDLEKIVQMIESEEYNQAIRFLGRIKDEIDELKFGEELSRKWNRLNEDCIYLPRYKKKIESKILSKDKQTEYYIDKIKQLEKNIEKLTEKLEQKQEEINELLNKSKVETKPKFKEKETTSAEGVSVQQWIVRHKFKIGLASLILIIGSLSAIYFLYYQLKQRTYDNLVNIADSLFTSDNFIEAKTYYDSAYSLKNEVFLKSKIDSCAQSYLSFTKDTNFVEFYDICEKTFPNTKSEIEKLKEKDGVKKFFIDSRDSTKYVTIKIGNQWWFSESLEYKINGSEPTNIHEKGARYYTQSLAKEAIPKSWNLPSEKDWEELFQQLDGKEKIVTKMKKIGFHLTFNGYYYNNQKDDAFKNDGYYLTSEIDNYRYESYSGNYIPQHKFYLFSTKSDNVNSGYLTNQSKMTVLCVKSASKIDLDD